MRYAQVIDGIVVNVIVWDGTTPLGLNGELINVDDVPCGPGWLYTDGVFVAPSSDSVVSVLGVEQDGE
jgi:hypothetical protein